MDRNNAVLCLSYRRRLQGDDGYGRSSPPCGDPLTRTNTPSAGSDRGDNLADLPDQIIIDEDRRVIITYYNELISRMNEQAARLPKEGESKQPYCLGNRA